MPYYRIVVWTKNRKKPYQGIRFIANESITAVQGLMSRQAAEAFKSSLVDCEVQMLAKTCTAVKELVEQLNKLIR